MLPGVEIIDVASFIGKKGLKAKGKRLSQYDVDTAEFIEPLPVPDLEVDEPIEIYDDDDDDTPQDGGETAPEVPEFPDSKPASSSFDDDEPIELSLF